MSIEIINLCPWLSAVTSAAAVAIGVDSLANSRYTEGTLADGGATMRAKRRRRVAEGNSTFKGLGAVVDEIANLIGPRLPPARRAEIVKDFARSAEQIPWTVEEFLAVGVVEAVATATALGLFLIPLLGARFALILAVMIGVFFVPQKCRSLHKLAAKRLNVIRRRLPFAIDLISQMMQAGASFGEAIETIVREDSEHPLAIEFAVVCREIELGRSRSEALQGIAERLDEETMNDFVFAVLRGEELGTPLTDVLNLQAVQMREKRSQWGEQAAGEAEVNLTFPVMVIMVACLIVVVAPLVLPPLLSY